MIGALYAAGMPASEIKHIALKTNWKNVLKFTIPNIGLISRDGIFRFMENSLPAKLFSALSIPLVAVATELLAGQKVVLTTGSIAKTVQASYSMPIIYTPTGINMRMLVDGGLVSQLPVITVREELGIKQVITVNVNYKALELDQFDNVIKIATHLSAL